MKRLSCIEKKALLWVAELVLMGATVILIFSTACDMALLLFTKALGLVSMWALGRVIIEGERWIDRIGKV